MLDPSRMHRTVALIAASVAAACARTPDALETKQPAPPVHIRSAHAFAIYEDDVERDMTSGLVGLPDGFQIFHEPYPPHLGYVHAALEGVPQAAMIERVQAWSATGVVPFGDRLLLGKTSRGGVRTYLVKFRGIVDATDVAGAMIRYVTDDTAEVMLSFEASAMDRLSRALGKPKAHFRIVVRGFVEADRFELVADERWEDGRLPHGTRWVSRLCSSHTAVLRMDGPSDLSPKARAEALVAELPPWRSVEVCSDGS